MKTATNADLLGRSIKGSPIGRSHGDVDFYRMLLVQQLPDGQMHLQVSLWDEEEEKVAR